MAVGVAEDAMDEGWEDGEDGDAGGNLEPEDPELKAAEQELVSLPHLLKSSA